MPFITVVKERDSNHESRHLKAGLLALGILLNLTQLMPAQVTGPWTLICTDRMPHRQVPAASSVAPALQPDLFLSASYHPLTENQSTLFLEDIGKAAAVVCDSPFPGR